MRFLFNIIISAVAVLVASYVLPGVHVDGFLTALIVAIILGLVNLFIRPILFILTLPINILTLGLFTFVINALLVLIVASLVTGFQVDGFWAALWFSLVVSIVSSVFHSLSRPH